MMRTTVILGIIAALPGAAAADAAFRGDGFHDDFERPNEWQPRSDWLPNASDGATLAVADGVLTATVPEAGRGMKWTRPIPLTDGTLFPYLVVRYRAFGVAARGDYFVYVNDDANAEVKALLPEEIVADGEWHVLAIDLPTIAEAGNIHTLAFQVQAEAGPARVEFGCVALSSTFPTEARLVTRADAPARAPDLTVRLRPAADWPAQPDWLDNASTRHSSADADGGVRLEVAEAGRGMKWSMGLESPLDPAAYRYVTIRYRATALAARADYALAAISAGSVKGLGYAALVPPGAFLADGVARRLTLRIPQAVRALGPIGSLAAQVQAADSGATLDISEITFTNTRKLPTIEEAIAFEPGAEWDGLEAIDISRQCNTDVMALLPRCGLASWFEGQANTVVGVPFQLSGPAHGDLIGTDLNAEESTATLHVGRQCGELYLLLLAAMSGNDDPIRGEGPLTRISDVDRFLLRLHYDDGTTEEQFPIALPSGQPMVTVGVQALCAFVDGAKTLDDVEVYDGSRQTGFYVAAATVNTSADQPHASLAPPRIPTSALSELPAGRTTPWTRDGYEVVAANGYCQATVDISTAPRLLSLTSPEGESSYLAEPAHLVTLRVAGQVVPPEVWRLTEASVGDSRVDASYEIPVGGHRFAVDVTLSMDPLYGLGLEGSVRHLEGEAVPVAFDILTTPVLIGRIEDLWHCFPEQGTVISNQPAGFRRLISGIFPMQFESAFNPVEGLGAHLFTQDTAELDKEFVLNKDDSRVTLGTSYVELALGGGETRTIARTFLAILPGDWRTGFEAYKAWAATWYRPLMPRQQWFREVFNFRQRFLYWVDPLADANAKRIELERAVDEANEHFGGVDYLHVFDWGNCGPYGRVYGRTGDYDPGDYLPGGWAELKRSVDSVKARGVPVGFYIEGYLLAVAGKLGQTKGPEWQIRGANGNGLFWPGDAEMFVCPGVEEWREVQESTYRRMVERMGADGMYLDQFGFAFTDKRCYAANHGHPVPSHPATVEREMTERVHRAMAEANSNAVLYTECIPSDVNSQYQDGSFTYTMNNAFAHGARVPIDLFRFAFPDFKVIEILYCDKPTGHWATGVKWVFFNGEAMWLEGPAVEWFAPQTRRAIRKCYSLLHEHRDAFMSATPQPLVPTEMPGVYANCFPNAEKTVYTLYNEQVRTVSGPVLRIPHSPGARYYDAWNERDLTPSIDGAQAVIETALGPQSVGCIVVTRE